MVRLRNASTRSGAGPIIGTLGALGLTVAFVALRRSKPRQGDQDRDKRKALATYLRDHLAGADTAIQVVQGLRDAYRGGPEGALFESLYDETPRRPRRRRGRSFGRARIHLAVHETTGGSGDRECPSRRGWRRDRQSGDVCVSGRSARRSRSACRASDACGEPRRRLSGWRTGPVVGALSNWEPDAVRRVGDH